MNRLGRYLATFTSDYPADHTSSNVMHWNDHREAMSKETEVPANSKEAALAAHQQPEGRIQSPKINWAAS